MTSTQLKIFCASDKSVTLELVHTVKMPPLWWRAAPPPCGAAYGWAALLTVCGTVWLLPVLSVYVVWFSPALVLFQQVAHSSTSWVWPSASFYTQVLSFSLFLQILGLERKSYFLLIFQIFLKLILLWFVPFQEFSEDSCLVNKQPQKKEETSFIVIFSSFCILLTRSSSDVQIWAHHD